MSWFWQSQEAAPTSKANSDAARPRTARTGCPVDVATDAPPAQRSDSASCPVSQEAMVNPRNFMPELSQRPIYASQKGALPTERTRSTIPKAALDEDPSGPPSSAPAEEGDDLWVYPSPQQFFNAVLKKGFTDTEARDVPAMVQIHNQVNERAWQAILQWEEDKAQACGGPKLVQFRGDATVLTPKARMLGWLGYARPFDTHFWTVDRCGQRVEYVIDFYKGKQQQVSAGGAGPDERGLIPMPSFYLDVRPAGVEGFPARLAKVFNL